MTPVPPKPEDTTIHGVTTGQPIGPCFLSGSCDTGGDAHIATLYGITSADDCQSECAYHSDPSCNSMTWYGDSKMCMVFTECKSSGENC